MIDPITFLVLFVPEDTENQAIDYLQYANVYFVNSVEHDSIFTYSIFSFFRVLNA